MRLAVTVTSALLLALPALAEDDPRRAAVHRRAELDARGETPEWERHIRRAFEKKISFEFLDTPLCEAIAFLAELTKQNIALDPYVLLDKGATPVTLKARDMSLASALSWVMKIAELTFVLKHEAVFLTDCDRLAEHTKLVTYDVRDLLMTMKDNPGPPLEAFFGGTQTLPWEERNELTIETIAVAIREAVGPNEWATEFGTSIEDRVGHIVVRQRPSIHEAIAELLRQMREEKLLQACIEAKLVAVAESFLEELRGLSKPGEGTIYLRRAQLNLVAGALMDGKQAELVHAANLTCFNGQRNHTHAGEQVEYFSNVDKKHRMAFLGTVLDVRPFVSFDRKYVTMDVRLHRTEPARGAALLARVYRFRSRATCLDTDTVMIAGASMPKEAGKPRRRLVALVTPTILRLEPPKRRDTPAGE